MENGATKSRARKSEERKKSEFMDSEYAKVKRGLKIVRASVKAINSLIKYMLITYKDILPLERVVSLAKYACIRELDFSGFK
jgi:hypothetical protein